MGKFIIIVTVGYMLKVLKSGNPTLGYKSEFDSIKHGDYAKVIKIIWGSIPFLVTYKEG